MSESKGIDYSFLKGPIQLSIDITNKCNIRCLHCYNYSGENLYIKDELTDKELIKLIDDICKMKPFNVCFCGGEPLLRKDILLKLVKKLSDNEINSSVVTNGILLTKDVARELKEAGIGNVQISLDGKKESHERLRGKSGTFESAIEALKNLKENSINRNIAFSPTSWNINDFKTVVKVGLDMGVKEIRVQQLMPIGRASKNNELIPTNSQYRNMKRMIIEADNMVRRLGKSIRFDWGDPIDHLIRYSEQNIFTYMFGISANGNIKPSMYLPLSVGNVRKHSIIEYWDKGLYDIYKLDKFKNMAKNFKSVKNMKTTNYDLPENFIEEDIQYDIIEEKFLLNLK